MEIYTIGFTQKSASDFFGLLRDAGIRTLVDIRLYREDNAGAWAPRHDVFHRLRQHLLQEPQTVILAVGLTRAFSPNGDTPRHWLQVNNIHVQDPTIL